jgi:hypothetical protein
MTYDNMIMSIDLMTFIGITVDCEERCASWGGTDIPLERINTLSDYDNLNMLYNAAKEPYILQEAEKRQITS